MDSTLLFFDRATRRASVALTAAALVVGCDTERAVSPATTPTATAPATAQPAVTATSNLVLWTYDTNNKYIGKASFKMIGPQFIVSTFTDNDANDADPTIGKIVLNNLLVGSYNICETVPPFGYLLPDTPCHPATVTSLGTAGVTPFISKSLPYIWTGFVDQNIARIDGGIVTVKDSTGFPIFSVNDNGGMDHNNLNGYISIMLPNEGKFTVCVMMAPSGYALAPGSIPCVTTTVTNNTSTNIGAFKIYPAPSASWGVQDGFGAPIGPSSFTISTGRFNSIKVVDNTLNDLDPAVGKFIVKLPSAAVYTLCETVPPPNRYNAAPACRTVDVSSGKAVWAGWFVNYEKQVISQ